MKENYNTKKMLRRVWRDSWKLSIQCLRDTILVNLSFTSSYYNQEIILVKLSFISAHHSQIQGKCSGRNEDFHRRFILVKKIEYILYEIVHSSVRINIIEHSNKLCEI